MMKKNNRAEKGQSTIEFIFTFAFGLSIILLIFNSAMTYTTGYLTHYATFMASRVYLTSENYFGDYGQESASFNLAETRAREAFNAYNLQIFNVPNTGFAVNPPGGEPAEYLTVGARTLFEQSIDALGKVAGQKKLELASESFLGKEPTRTTCAARVCFAITGQETCDERLDITLFDDGC